MNKGLEALNKINSGAVAVLTPYDGWQDENIRVYYAEEFNIIENELKEKEKQDHYVEMLEDRLNNVETTCGRYKQALEIIKNKKVDIPLFIRCRKLEDYNGICIINGSSELTQEEGDLLKEVLNV